MMGGYQAPGARSINEEFDDSIPFDYLLGRRSQKGKSIVGSRSNLRVPSTEDVTHITLRSPPFQESFSRRQKEHVARSVLAGQMAAHSLSEFQVPELATAVAVDHEFELLARRREEERQTAIRTEASLDMRSLDPETVIEMFPSLDHRQGYIYERDLLAVNSMPAPAETSSSKAEAVKRERVRLKKLKEETLDTSLSRKLIAEQQKIIEAIEKEMVANNKLPEDYHLAVADAARCQRLNIYHRKHDKHSMDLMRKQELDKIWVDEAKARVRETKSQKMKKHPGNEDAGAAQSAEHQIIGSSYSTKIAELSISEPVSLPTRSSDGGIFVDSTKLPPKVFGGGYATVTERKSQSNEFQLKSAEPQRRSHLPSKSHQKATSAETSRDPRLISSRKERKLKAALKLKSKILQTRRQPEIDKTMTSDLS